MATQEKKAAVKKKAPKVKAASDKAPKVKASKAKASSDKAPKQKASGEQVPAEKGSSEKAAKTKAPREQAPPPRLAEQYQKEIVPELMKQFSYKTVMQVPRIQKIVLNMGVGEAVNDKKILEHAVGDMTKIAGQKPAVTKARKSIAIFKIREGYPIGCKVTLRSTRMYEFLDRLISVAIPRVRDFRGISGRAFDGRGNFNMGVKEQIIFPEIEYDKIDALRGLNITITTTAKTDDEARALLSAFRFPFRT